MLQMHFNGVILSCFPMLQPTNFSNPMYKTLYSDPEPQGDLERKGLLKKEKKKSKKAMEHLLADDDDFDPHDPSTSFA